MIPNLQRFLLRLVLSFWGLLTIVYAQPNYLQTNISGSYVYYALSDLGAFRQYTVTASGSNNREWAFLTNNNYGSCGAPACAVWRHYNAAGSQMPFNSVIQPNGGANYGALYNNNVNSGSNGNQSFTQATTNGKSYTFNFYENGAANSHFSILETNYFPTNLTGTPTMNSGGTVSITGLPTLATGEYLYCRYSSDNFVTSSIVDVTISGTNGEAQIPPFSSGTNMQFYLYSSNMSSSYILAQAASFGEKTHDLFTLRILVPTVGATYSGTFGGPVIVKGTTGSNNNALVYSTLKAAFDAINLNNLHQGVINMWINGNTTETVTASLTTTAPTSVTIQPSGGAARTVSGIFNSALVSIGNNSITPPNINNITINGLNTGGNSLTFENTSATSSATALTLLGVSSGNINNCTFKGSQISETASGVIFFNNSSANNSNITLQNCKITRSGTNSPVNGITLGSNGTPTGTNSNLTFLNNEIYDYATYNVVASPSTSNATSGIKIQKNNNTIAINANHFYCTFSSTFLAFDSWGAITAISNTSYGINVAGNYIGGSAINAAGSFTLNNSRLQPIRLTVGTTAYSMVDGNTIKNISNTVTSSSDVHCGISLTGGKIKCGTLSPNIVEDISLISNGTLATPQLSGIIAGTSAALDSCFIRNNRIRRLTLSGTFATNRLSGIFAYQSAGGIYNISNNIIGDTVLANGLTNNKGDVIGIEMRTTNPNIHVIKNNFIAGLSSLSSNCLGIYVRGGAGNDSIKNNIIRANSAFLAGYGVRVDAGSAYHVIEGNTVRNNTASTTFSGINYGSVNLSYSIQNNNIYGNTSTSTNYGIQGTGGTTATSSHIINNNIIRDNTGSTTAAIFVASSAVPYTINNNTIYNLISTSSATFGISGTFSGVATHSLNNNEIRNITGASSSGNVTGIIVAASNATLNINNNNVHHLTGVSGTLSGISLNYTTTTTASHNLNNNTIAYLTGTNTASSGSNVVGIGVSSNSPCTISNNTVRGISTANSITFNPLLLPPALVPSLIGISVSGSGSPMIASQNTIFGLTATNNAASPSVAGIAWIFTSAPGTIDRNFIHSLNVTSSITTNSAIAGIVNYCTSSGVTTQNNMIRLGLDSLGNSITTGHSIAGIADFAGTNYHYYNSIYIGGSSVSAGASSTCFSGAFNSITLRNNIFQNARSSSASGTPCHYGVSGSGASSWNSNYNLFYVTGTNGIMAYMNNPLASPVTYSNFCDWRSIANQDANSVWGDPNFIAPTGTASTLNLHLNTPTAAEGKGISITTPSITTDYDNDTRSTTPDIGADEGTFAVTNLTISASPVSQNIPAFCTGTSSFNITYGTITGGATLYSVTDVGGNATGFVPIIDATITTSPITVNIPNNLPAGTYQFALIFKNPIYCITRGYNVDVTIEDYPSLFITNPAPICAPGTIDITTSSTIAGSTLSGGTNISYWANSSANSPIPSSSGTASALTVAGTYYIMATTNAGCADIKPVVVTINASPALAPNASDRCIYANNTTLNATANGAGSLVWYNNNAHSGTALGNGNTLNVSTSATYYVFETQNGCFSPAKAVVANVRPNISTNVPTIAGDYWATDAITNGTWTNFCDCPNDLLLVSLELGGQNIGTNLVSNSVSVGNGANEYGVKVHVVGGNSVHIPISVPYVNTTINPQGWWVFPRTWDVFPHTQPTTPVGVRYYYTPTDFNKLNIDISAAGLGTIPNEGKMSFYKLLSTNAANALDNNHIGISANQIAVYYNDAYHPNWTLGNLAPLAGNTHYAEYDVASFSGGGGGGGGSGMPPLPLRLKYFKGTKVDKIHQLSWETEMESNLSNFEVERGIDNINFEKIGTKKAVGYSQTEQSYNFNDMQPYIGKNVYRLKMIDNDGQYSYSNEIELFNMASFGYAIYPNPAEDKIFLSISDASEKIVFSLYDVTGKQVFSQKYEGSVHALQEITTQTFSRGVYVYKIVHDGEAFQGRIMLK